MTTLSLRTLNRTLLLRQHLLERVGMPAAKLIEHLVGMQAQVPENPYVAMWSRLKGFDPMELSNLISKRKAVRGSLMRATLHLVTARDWHRMRPLFQPHLTRTLDGTAWGKATADLDRTRMLAVATEALEQQPMGRMELGRLLEKRFPSYDADSLGAAAVYLSTLVQVAPRGMWKRSGKPEWTTTKAWLGRDIDTNPSIDKLLLRYFARFGPATVADAANWSRLTGLREVVDRLGKRLRTYRNEDGRELFDVPEGEFADAEVDAPIRFLPEYDNLFLGHADRRRIGSDAGLVRGPVLGNAPILVDGTIQAMWRIKRTKKTATMYIEPLRPLKKAMRSSVLEEGAALFEFLAGDAEREVIQIVSDPR